MSERESRPGGGAQAAQGISVATKHNESETQATAPRPAALATLVELEASGDPAQDLVRAWLACTAPDESGTPARKLYEHFVQFCRVRPDTVQGEPSETMWGRQLSMLGLATRRTAAGRSRPLRVVGDEPPEQSAWPLLPDGSPNYATSALAQVSPPSSVVTGSPDTGGPNASEKNKSAVLGAGFGAGSEQNSEKNPVHSGEESELGSNPSATPVLAWRKWQLKLVAARTPEEQLDVCYRALGAVIHKSRLDEPDVIELVAWLVEAANAIGVSAGLPSAPQVSAVKVIAHRTDVNGQILPARGCPCLDCQWAFVDPFEEPDRFQELEERFIARRAAGLGGAS